eukprot:2275645-Pyramimonas_sp.AAC.1
MEMLSARVQLKGDKRCRMIKQGPESVLVIDCKSLCDAVTGSENSALGLSDKRAAIECMAFKQGVQECGSELRWFILMRRCPTDARRSSARRRSC